MKKGKRSLTEWSLVTLTFLAVVTSAGIAQAESPECTDSLLGSRYSCLIDDPGVTDLPVCIEFEPTMDGVRFLGYLSADWGGFIVKTDLLCGCRMSGSFSTPRFNESADEFLCSYVVANYPEFDIPGAMAGKITGDRFQIEAVAGGDGIGWTVECTPDPNCTP